MTKSWIFLPLLPMMALSAGAFGALYRSAPNGGRCEIRATTTPVGVQLEGIIYGAPGESGFYQLQTVKSGNSGDAETTQGGGFTIASDRRAVVSSSEFNLNAGDIYRTDLTVTGSAGLARCEKHVP